MLFFGKRKPVLGKELIFRFILALFSFGVAYVASVPVYAASIPVIRSDSYPNEHGWYNTTHATFSWEVPSSVTIVRTLYSQDQVVIPTKQYDPPIASKTFTVDEDGIYYMHVQFKDADGWGDVAHRKFQVDTHAPRLLSISSNQGTTTTDIQPTLIITADDALSGLDHIAIAVDGATPTNYPISPSNKYKLAKMSPGKHAISAAIFDKADNKTDASLDLTVIKLDPPTILDYTKHAESGEKVTVFGHAYPQKLVEIAVVGEGKLTFFETVRANANGEFTDTFTHKLATGAYDISARVIDDSGSVSDYSDPKTLVVESTFFVRVAMFIINWLSLALIAIIAGVLIAGVLWYSIVQFARFRRKINRTFKEVEQALKVNVAALRRDAEEFHTILVKAEKKRELTKEEHSILKKFKKRLDSTEKELEKKLERIG